ncbi:hypothetical protein DS2_06166 [Catenovulum agarivorans DS-2]|uniref:DUF883 domain-containing protein n=1 Tax=Catenovulum agarivorans DS-2 TaxID=1328313 RepID=W7QSK6_9ALTE|nr:hypothetical protein [Catenovulum agarivorans]EWH10853.1 hypothetical protein DS2_06166 [Catenovulum agarivorans DS-2]
MATAKANSSTPISDKMSDALHQGVDSISERSAKTESAVREGAQHSAEALKDKQQQAKSAWQSSALKNYVDENPVATAGIAFAAGALLSSLLVKKK